MMHYIHIGQAPVYLADAVQLVATSSARPGLRSATTSDYRVPRTRMKLGERAFSVAGPATWKSLPAVLRNTSDTARFKRHLKAHFYQLAFS